MTAQSDSSLYLGQHLRFRYLKQKPPLKAHADLFNSLYFGMSLYLYPYFVHASGDGSGESAHLAFL